jgi:hypothetical protein
MPAAMHLTSSSFIACAAAKAARGGIIDLGERLKQAVQTSLRDADPGIA